jgi:hypothetical protein
MGLSLVDRLRCNSGNGVVSRNELAHCEIWAGMASQGAFREKRARIVYGLFDTIRSGFVVPGNVCPNFEYIDFCKRSKDA